MNANEITLRPATLEDSARLLDWRNTPEVRAMSFDTSEIDALAHRTWFSRALADPSIVIFIGMAAGTPVGMVRFNMEAGDAHISILLEPRFHGQGLAKPLLSGAMADLNAAATRFRAEVRSENHASLALFRSCGFSETSDNHIHNFYYRQRTAQ